MADTDNIFRTKKGDLTEKLMQATAEKSVRFELFFPSQRIVALVNY